MMNLSQRKIIQIFKTFIEKIFVPQLSKMDFVSQQQWNKFSTLISFDPINIGQLQLYVDTLPITTPIGSIQAKTSSSIDQNKQLFFNKMVKVRNEPATQFASSFNPSKTFGGKSGPMFPIRDYQQTQTDKQGYNFSKDFSRESKDAKDKQDGAYGISTQMVLPIVDNQSKLEKFCTQSGTYQHKNHYN